jgi:Rieske Fe-S protein
MSISQGDQDRDYPDGRPLSEQPRWRQDFPTDVPADDALARREFTKFLVLTSGAFVAGQCWIGLMSLLRDDRPLPEKRIAAEADVPLHGVHEFRYPTDDDPCLLIRLPDGTPNGKLVAYGQQCSHLSCAVIPQPERGQLHCPCHHGYFEIHEGRPIAGPPRRPLPRIQLAVREGAIYATGVELRTV